MKNCSYCGKPRKAPKAFNYVSKATWEADPYCSAKCCKADHGVVELKGHTSRNYEQIA